MNLSTSNSKLVVSVTLCLLLLVAYNYFLFKSPPEINVFHNQWIKNQALAERYLYRDATPDVVIVGSSMAARLDANRIGPNAHNLAFSSSGSSTGLEIIERSERYPEILLVETSILEKESDQELLDRVFHPVLMDVKRYLKFLRYQYQPGNLLMTWVMGRFGNSAEEKRRQSKSPEVLEYGIARQVQINADDTEISAFDFSTLLSLLQSIVKQGTKVVLFHTPVAEKILQSPRYQSRLNRVRAEFSEFIHFDEGIDNASVYQTNDGVHLDALSAQDFSDAIGLYIKESLLTD